MDILITVSLCMIVKDEEQTLARCLDSICELVDEIIIVDTGSTDRTKEIASAYTDKIYDFPWIDDFSAARNFSFSKASKQYCMWLDADDILESADQKNFLTLKNSLSPETDVVMMRYHTAFDAVGSPIFTYYRDRLIRRGSGLSWEGAVHEAISPNGKVVYNETAISHHKIGRSDPNRNLRIFEHLLSQGKKLDPREQFYYARELTYHGRDKEAVKVLKRFLNNKNGWVENKIEACRILSQCFTRLGAPEKAFSALLKSFRFGPPRAELCCDIGQFFFDRSDFFTSSYWYKCALSCKRNDTSGGFILPDCYGYIPLIQLCVCSYHMGNVAQAAAYNEKAGKIKPNDPAYQYNRKFFEQAF